MAQRKPTYELATTETDAFGPDACRPALVIACTGRLVPGRHGSRLVNQTINL